MAWLRIDDTFAGHPKMAKLTDRERWVWIRTLCYCARYATNTGAIEAPGEIIGLSPSLLDKLERIGLVDRNGNGVPVVHDWNEYNGKAAVERDQARERKKRQRDRERDDSRDTSVTERDDESDGSVTVTSRARAHDPSPSRPKEEVANAPSSLPARQKPRDELWDALVAECGPVTNEMERGRRNKSLKALRESHATAAEVHERSESHRRRWPDADLTATSLANNWSLLAKPVPRRGVDPDQVLADAFDLERRGL